MDLPCRRRLSGCDTLPCYDHLLAPHIHKGSAQPILYDLHAADRVCLPCQLQSTICSAKPSKLSLPIQLVEHASMRPATENMSSNLVCQGAS